MARPIFLIGYMCSGKTTLGRALEVASGWRYVDLDDEIVREQGMTVAEIFATRGEQEFRRLESEMLARWAEAQDVVIGCGGGTPCNPANMELMNRCGTTVHLRCRRDRLLTRLLEGREKRPLLAGRSDAEVERIMEEGLASREKFYSRAAREFDSSLLECREEIDLTVNNFINLIINDRERI